MGIPINQIHNPTKCYGKNLVLKCIDLEVQPSQIVDYIGPNGASKSTTIRILNTLLTWFGGSAKVSGLEVSQYPLDDVFPIPDTQMDLNPRLKQNPGY